MISVLIEQRIVVKFHMKLFLKVKLLISITTLRFLLNSVKKSEKKTRIVERKVMGSSSGQRTGSHCIVCKDVSSQV